MSPLGSSLRRLGRILLIRGGQAIIPLITRLRMSHEESYAKAFPFDRMVDGMLDPEMIEDAAWIMNEAAKDNVQANIIINSSAGGYAPRIAQKIPDRLRSENQQGLF